MAENDYDAFAAAYDADNEVNAWNAYYERPAILALVGDVAGLSVLDAGCGGGAHAAALLERGAVVTGIDASAGMLEIAQRRLERRARLLSADLNEPLPFTDKAFDLILASLVLHYLPDWSRPLSEFNRLLPEGGRLVLSTHHPFMDHASTGRDNYFETYSFDETWQRGGKDIAMRFWHRPLHAMFDALKSAGFQIDIVSEPQPDPRASKLFPQAYQSLTTKPRFLFFSAVKA
ncbi:class I SAM-dependent methyltransferase [Rhizobium ruizarguesonis]|uniref:class I SAM-dependent methyltransferase n=1 Tax=Rhizobium ruizarguesonis TaxID=2081791 RepID=UPI00102F9647|nr:class I SAM-dependent methyltransferase [Rhizobium ruizarguesonis]MBY5854359.1 methyltransferase domain-containing protein [Rhizobium leguminosarum]TAT77493.1 SAM-dependent methyltransferase [Rhizobium ruizarguesonis]TAT89410.1 SAM-dependent methyltransferase [Rhizobium ruizarguesonis]TAU04194.1 SAM-dependent methyltransferase [Rhizobium ruizarguesonis]TAY78221.1 SAM-dependent methyltransferase [Rhizobium ruizarguesonis]